MKTHLIAVLGLVLSTRVSQFAQDTSVIDKTEVERRGSMVGLVRTVNTLESADLYQHGSYESWHALLERHPTDLSQWLATFYTQDTNTHFRDAQEILPGWSLRLNVNTNGQGYVLVLEGTADKTGYAVLSDERGVIRECQYLR